MTRKEEIEKEAMLRFDSDDTNCAITAFIAGAEYADRTMLDRACKWLQDGGYFVNSNETIEDFRKAMKGGVE